MPQFTNNNYPHFTTSNTKKVQKMQQFTNNNYHQITILPYSTMQKSTQHKNPQTYHTTYHLKNTQTNKQTTFTIYYDEDLHFYISYNNYLLPSYLFSTSYEGDPENQILQFIFTHFTHLLNQHQHKINPLPYLFFSVGESLHHTITTLPHTKNTYTTTIPPNTNNPNNNYPKRDPLHNNQ